MHNRYKKYYFINKFDTKIFDNQDKDTIFIYRNYANSRPDKNIIIKLKYYFKKKKFKFLLSNNFKLALKLNLDGAYIPSFNKSTNHLNFSIKKNFIIIGSAHNLKEIRIKEIQKVQQIVISSIFKRNSNYLGINKYKLLSKLSKNKTIPLGGITFKNLKKLQLIKNESFAGISYFE